MYKFQGFPPFRFYVKSIFVILKPQKLPFWLFEHLEFWICEYFWLFQVWNSQKFQIQCLENGWNDSFDPLWDQPKLISRKIRVTRKLVNFHIVKYPRWKFSIRLPRSVALFFINSYLFLLCRYDDAVVCLLYRLLLSKLPFLSSQGELLCTL